MLFIQLVSNLDCFPATIQPTLLELFEDVELCNLFQVGPISLQGPLTTGAIAPDPNHLNMLINQLKITVTAANASLRLKNKVNSL